MSLATLAALLVLPGAAHAATTFTVNTTADGSDANVGDNACATADGHCTLRAAIEELNENGDPGVINLPAGTFKLPLGHLEIQTQLAIKGAGQSATTIDGSATDDGSVLFDDRVESALSFEDLTLTGAKRDYREALIAGPIDALTLKHVAVTGNLGDPVIATSPEGASTVTLDHASVTKNQGGAMLHLDGSSGATLKLLDSTFSDNSSDSSERTPAFIFIDAGGGSSAVDVERSVIEGNVLSGPETSQGLLDFAARPGSGGTATLTVADSRFSHNALGDDGNGVLNIEPTLRDGGALDATIARSSFAGNSAGDPGYGYGGAVSFAPYTRAEGTVPQNLTVTDSSFTGNSAAASQAGYGSGGAIDFSPDASNAKLTIRGSTFAGNSAGSKTLPSPSVGGALAFWTGSLDVANSTFTGNSVINSAAYLGGGAIAIMDPFATASFNNVTIAGNQVTGNGQGGGIAVAYQLSRPTRPAGEANVSFGNSIVAGNTADAPQQQAARAAGQVPSDCFGTGVGSAGHNIEGDTTCEFDQPGDKQRTDPKLAPLADNGGPTQTRAIDTTSPAFDAGPATGCEKTDQRGVIRPQFQACDIGAFELAPPPPAPTPTPTPTTTAPTPQPQGQVQGETVRKCVSRRQFRIRLRVPKGARVVSSVVFVNGRRVAVRHGHRLTAAVNLRKLPKGRFRVKIVLGLADGHEVVGVRRYHTCHKAIPPKRIPRV